MNRIPEPESVDERAARHDDERFGPPDADPQWATDPIGNGPWRLLVLDRDHSDPKWCICTIMLPGDVRPAGLDSAARYLDWDQVAEWVRAQTGGFKVSLVPVMDPLAWTILPEVTG